MASGMASGMTSLSMRVTSGVAASVMTTARSLGMPAASVRPAA